MMHSISRPTLIINEQVARQNIKFMADKAVQSNVSFEPHFKTHQSKEVGEWFRDEGVTAITVSSVSMAQYFATNGWSYITIAFPVNLLEINEIDQLSQSVHLTLLLQDLKSIKGLKLLTGEVNILLEIDVGYHRSGIAIDDLDEIDEIIKAVKSSKHIFKGFYCHAGNSYLARSKGEIKAIYDEMINKILELKNSFAEFNPHIAIGDTPTCSVVNDFDGVDSIHPGNFVFYDYTQFNIGSCTILQIAAYLQCPVVAKNQDRKELVIYGGGIHLSKEGLSTSEGYIYGIIGKLKDANFYAYEDSFVKSISQEHGIISCTASVFSHVEVGDLVTILPIHSCMTVDCMSEIYSTTGKFISKMRK